MNTFYFCYTFLKLYTIIIWSNIFISEMVFITLGFVQTYQQYFQQGSNSLCHLNHLTLLHSSILLVKYLFLNLCNNFLHQVVHWSSGINNYKQHSKLVHEGLQNSTGQRRQQSVINYIIMNLNFIWRNHTLFCWITK